MECESMKGSSIIPRLQLGRWCHHFWNWEDIERNSFKKNFFFVRERLGLENLSLVFRENNKGRARDRNVGVIIIWMVSKAFWWDDIIKGARVAILGTLFSLRSDLNLESERSRERFIRPCHHLEVKEWEGEIQTKGKTEGSQKNVTEDE